MMKGDKYKIFRLDADRITPNPLQPRKRFDEAELKELSASIKQNGIIQPITVRKIEGGRYEIVAGERRFRAAQMAGYAAIPCILADCGPEQAAVLAVTENIQRSNLDCFEEANAIRSLMEKTGATQEEMARRLGKSQSAVANKLRLLRLSDEEIRRIREGKLTERHARALLSLPNPDLRKNALDLILRHQYNVEQSEKLIARLASEKRPEIEKRKRRFVLKDIRIFFNTLEKAVDMVRLSGLDARITRTDGEEYIECIVRIPKRKTEKIEKA